MLFTQSKLNDLREISDKVIELKPLSKHVSIDLIKYYSFRKF